MRKTRFRDVLWQVARKQGFSPESGNFLNNQAIAIGEYINEWIDKLYPAEDWPEWTQVHQFVVDPTTHIVRWDASASDDTLPPGGVPPPRSMGRIVNVYLLDPRTIRTPIGTKFMLREEGIHCGFEHGSAVWIKYIEPPPRFTAEPWDSNDVYAKGDTVYSGTTGECYKSLVNNNLGHDPALTSSIPLEVDLTPTPIATEVTQAFAATELGITPQDKIIRIDFNNAGSIAIANPPALGALIQVPVMDKDSVILGVGTHPCMGTETLDVIITDIANQLIAGLGAGWTVTPDTGNLTLTIENASDFIVVNNIGGGDAPIYYPTSVAHGYIIDWQQLQPFVASATATVVTPQIITATLSANQVVPGATYNLKFIDSAGVEHFVTYESDIAQSSGEVLTGILTAIQTAAGTDDFVAGLGAGMDGAGLSFTFRTTSDFSVEMEISRAGSPWWMLIPFPSALATAVIRGATSGVLTEWGQIGAGMAIESRVPSDQQQSRGDFETTPTAPLTTQQKGVSRYKIGAG